MFAEDNQGLSRRKPGLQEWSVICLWPRFPTTSMILVTLGKCLPIFLVIYLFGYLGHLLLAHRLSSCQGRGYSLLRCKPRLRGFSVVTGSRGRGLQLQHFGFSSCGLRLEACDQLWDMGLFLHGM